MSNPTTTVGKLETFQVEYLDEWQLPLEMTGYSFVITDMDGGLAYQASPADIIEIGIGRARHRWTIALPAGQDFDATWHATDPDGQSRVALTTFTVVGVETPPEGVWLTEDECTALSGVAGCDTANIGRATTLFEMITRYTPDQADEIVARWGDEELLNIKRAVARIAHAYREVEVGTGGSVGEMEREFGKTITSLSQPGGLGVGFAAISRPATDTRTEVQRSEWFTDALFYIKRLHRARRPQDGNGRQQLICSDEWLTPKLAAARYHQAYMFQDPNRPFRRSEWR